MFIGVPAWTLIILLSALKPLDGEDMSLFPAASALGLYGAFMLMYLAPKLAGFLDVAMTPGGLARYGGGARFARGAATEIVFSLLLAPSVTLRTSLFMLGLLFGKAVTWNGQARDAHALSWSDAARGLWPQTLFGAALAALGLWLAPALLLWSLPLTLGYVLAIPFAVATADPQLGESLARRGLCAIPEEIETPAILAALREGEAVIETTHPRPEPA
jgi:membrane glycosyltransferase